MTAISPSVDHDRLAHFPVSFFSMVMGVAGLGIALHKGAALYPALGPVSVGVTMLGFILLVALAGIYSMKIVQRPDAVATEFMHPVRLHFAPALSIGLLLLSVAVAPLSNDVSRLLLLVGAPLQFALSLLVVSRWLNHDVFQIGHVNPAWFIPIVGNIVVPIAAVGHGYRELSWLFFAIGIVFWLPLLGLILQRLILHPMMPERLRPTLAILIAPPAVGFLSYLKLNGGLDGFARILFYFAMVMVTLIAVQLPRLIRLPFFLSWWAYSFPLAAATVAAFAMHEQTGLPAFAWIGFILLALVSLVVAGLLVRTAIAAWRGEICQPE